MSSLRMICMKNHGLPVDCFRQVKLVLQVRSNLSPTISSVRLQLANKSWPHCMIIKHNQLSIFIRAWSVTFWAAEFASEGFNLVCTIWRQREDVRIHVPCNLQCLGTHALTKLCSEVQLIKVSIDKFYWL